MSDAPAFSDFGRQGDLLFKYYTVRYGVDDHHVVLPSQLVDLPFKSSSSLTEIAWVDIILPVSSDSLCHFVDAKESEI